MIGVGWIPRREPLIPEAVFLPKLELGKHLFAVEGRQLHGVASTRGLIVIGPESTLPWIPSASYFARSRDTADVYFPTGIEPDVPELLFARAVRHAARVSRSVKSGADALMRPPLLVAPHAWTNASSLIVSLCASGPIDISRLETWLESKE